MHNKIVLCSEKKWRGFGKLHFKKHEGHHISCIFISSQLNSSKNVGKGIFFYGWGRRETPPIALQPSRPFVLLTPILFPRSSPEALHARRRERPLLAKEGVWARNGRSNFARQSDFHVIAEFFHMPQSCNMGQTSPPKEGMLRNFTSKKSDGFGRV
jgi:hypothetical protein